MNLGDGIYQHEPNETDWTTGGDYPVTGARFNVTPYRLEAGFRGRTLMESATVPATGDEYPGIDYGAGYPPASHPGAGDWWMWIGGSTGWPNEYTLIIEGCTHNGTTITEGTRKFLRYWPGATSPTPLTAIRPFYTCDGEAESSRSRLGLGALADWEHKTTGLPSLTIDGARLYKAFFNTEPLIGTTISNPYTPSAGAVAVSLSGFTWDPEGGAVRNITGFYDSILDGDRIGNVDQGIAHRVVKFGSDPVRYRLLFDSKSEVTPGNWEVDYDLEPALLARTAAELPGAVTWLPRHEIPIGKLFDIRLDVSPYIREKWNGAAYVSSDSPEQVIYSSRLFYSPFES